MYGLDLTEILLGRWRTNQGLLESVISPRTDSSLRNKGVYLPFRCRGLPTFSVNGDGKREKKDAIYIYTVDYQLVGRTLLFRRLYSYFGYSTPPASSFCLARLP